MNETAKRFLQKGALSTVGVSTALSPVAEGDVIATFPEPNPSHTIPQQFFPSDETVMPYTLLSNNEQKEAERETPFLKGFNYIEFGYEGLGTNIDEYRYETAGPILDRLKSDGANSVTYIFPYKQEGPFDSSMTIDPLITPSDEVIRAFVQEAHARDLQVILRPFMKLVDNSQHWRGQIAPNDPEQWFASHEAVMQHYLQIAQEEGAEYFSFGSELTSMEQEQFTPYWSEILDEADAMYDGKILFSINWGHYIYGDGVNKELLSHPAIDEVGLSFYYEYKDVPPRAEKSAFVDAMSASPIMEMKKIHEDTGKNIIIVEVGTTSTEWSGKPWSGSQGGVYQEDQATYLAAACDAVIFNEELPFVSGFQVWQVDAGSLYTDPQTDTSFEVMNKLSEQAIVDCFERIN